MKCMFVSVLLLILPFLSVADHQSVRYSEHSALIFTYQTPQGFWLACGPSQCNTAVTNFETLAIELSFDRNKHGIETYSQHFGSCKIYLTSLNMTLSDSDISAKQIHAKILETCL